jgi:L-threonylcarbamoyladenylate synthase
VHVLDAAAAHPFAAAISPMAARLMAGFWPGPLTVIVPRNPSLGAAAAGGQNTVALRCPSHPVAVALLRAAAGLGVMGVAAPSANRFGRVSPTTAAHVQAEFDDSLRVLDGGPCSVGIESAIVDCSRDHPMLLRPGALTPAQIEAVAGQPLRARDAAAPRVSGSLDAHYAPRAAVRLMSLSQLHESLHARASDAPALAVYSRGSVSGLRHNAVHRHMPTDAARAAQELFSSLRAFDDEGVQAIWVEVPPSAAEWDGVRDRLQRASTAS